MSQIQRLLPPTWGGKASLTRSSRIASLAGGGDVRDVHDVELSAALVGGVEADLLPQAIPTGVQLATKRSGAVSTIASREQPPEAAPAVPQSASNAGRRELLLAMEEACKATFGAV